MTTTNARRSNLVLMRLVLIVFCMSYCGSTQGMSDIREPLPGTTNTQTDVIIKQLFHTFKSYNFRPIGTEELDALRPDDVEEGVWANVQTAASALTSNNARLMALLNSLQTSEFDGHDYLTQIVIYLYLLSSLRSTIENSLISRFCDMGLGAACALGTVYFWRRR